MRQRVLGEREQAFGVDGDRLVLAVLDARERDLLAQGVALLPVRRLVDRTAIDERIVQEHRLPLEIRDAAPDRGLPVGGRVLLLSECVEEDQLQQRPVVRLRPQGVEQLHERVLELALADPRAAGDAVVVAVAAAVPLAPAAGQRLRADAAAHEAPQREVRMVRPAGSRDDGSLRCPQGALRPREELETDDRLPVAIAGDPEAGGFQLADVDRVCEHPVDL